MSSLPTVRLADVNIGNLIEEICDQGTATTLIACCSRSYFLKQLVEYTRPSPIVASDLAEQHPSDEPTETEPEEESISLPPRQCPLLLPTLKLIAASSKVNLAFCPTIPTLRAYLSTLPIRTAAEDVQASRVVIVNILALHRDTSEFTLQGLSRSFALIASVNGLLQASIELVECADVQSETSNVTHIQPWDVEVPLLSGSIKIGEAGQGWASRKVSVKEFGNRWFNFE